jgi:hypothetical protein
MLNRSLPLLDGMGPRGTALAILGLTQWLVAEPHQDFARRRLEALTATLVTAHNAHADEAWCWVEPSLTYDNAMLPYALLRVQRAIDLPDAARVGFDMLSFLDRVCFEGSTLCLIGNDGWHSRGGERAMADEQPIDAAAFTLAYREAYALSGDDRFRERMHASFGWFLGQNRLGQPLADVERGGCRDGLGRAHVNQNQGAESTLSYLLALLALHEHRERG